MASKARKKNETSPNDCLLDDFYDDAKTYKCKICSTNFTDAKAREQHLIGKRHAKKLHEEKIKAENKIQDKENDSESNNSDEDELYCDVCDKNFTSYISYKSHVKGRAHAKNLKKQKLKKELDDMPEVIKKESKGNVSDEDDKPYAKCSICQKEFYGPESFKLHAKSATHLKKVKQAKMLDALKKDETENFDDKEIYSKCEVCKKQFSGVVPYQIHIKSNVHKKNLEKKKIAEELKEFCTKTDEGYVCKECKKIFTNPFALKQHLDNNSHEKQKAKEELAEFLGDHPEIVFVSSYDKTASENESDSDETDSMYFLVCKLCDVSFTGPESAKAHVKSKKHIFLRKEKQARKLLKEKKKVSSEVSDGNTNDKQTSMKASFDDSKASSSKHSYNNSDDEFEEI